MLTASLLEPTPGGPGEFWYSYANRKLHESIHIVQLTSSSPAFAWAVLSNGQFVSALPPPINLASLLPTQRYWININDPNRVPQRYDRHASQWVPIVSSAFLFPPLHPSFGDVWTDPNTLDQYAWGGSSNTWLPLTLNANSTMGVNLIPPTTNTTHAHAGPHQTQGGSFTFTNTPTPSSITMPSLSSNTILSVSWDNGREYVTVKNDGSIEYSSGYTPKLAAEAFWNTLVEYAPVKKLEAEVEDLRAKIKYAEDRGFKFYVKPAPIDPQDAWNAAMGVVSP